MIDVEYDYLTEEEVMNEAKTYCFIHDTMGAYHAVMQDRKKKTPMHPVVLKSLLIEEVQTTIDILNGQGKKNTIKTIEWRRVKSVV